MNSESVITVGCFLCAFIGYLIGGYLARISDMKAPKPKEIPDDGLVAEAYELCDRYTNSLQQRANREIVNGYVQQIVDAEKHNQGHAALEIRRRLSEHVQRMKMGS